MKKTLLFCPLLLGLLILGSCEKDDTGVENPPSVTLTNEEGIFEVKIGRNITIKPTVTNAIAPFYVWKLDGEVVSREAAYEFSSKIPGQYFLTFQVNAANGSQEKEIRVDVLALAPPKVVLPLDGEYIAAVTGRELEIIPDVMHSEDATYRWLLNREEVSTNPTYLFKQDGLGDYNLVLVVTNEDGEGRAEAIVRVGEIPELSFFFENDNIPVPLGRTVIIAPYISYATSTTTYEWEVDGVVQFGQVGATFSFTPATQGSYTIKVAGTGEENTASATVTVTCVAAEGAYRRPVTSSSSANWNKVYEFLAAPGQFVNEGYTVTTMEQANTYAEERMKSGAYISLGGFGGYIVVGFDHSIENKAGYNLAIKGNAFAGSSEPGIVWVMQDENGDGLPNDTWYELKGSESGKSETRQLYAVTYFKPTGSRQNVRWTDNYGGSGTVDINSYHQQDSYYPNWVAATSYTLRGTYLEARNYDESGNGTYWINAEYDWGYVDNYGTDLVGNETVLDLNNAIYPDGTAANLEYVDFVKVQVAVNASSGWLGEISTEVFGFRDMNME